MSTINVVRGIYSPELLWKLPHNVNNRRGKVAIIGGSPGHLKPILAIAEACLQFQVSQLILCLPEKLAQTLPLGLPEVTLVFCPETPAGSLSRQAMEPILSNINNADIALLGPGLSRHPETLQLSNELISRVTCPLALTEDSLEQIPLQALSSRKSSSLILTDAGILSKMLSSAGLIKEHGSRGVEEVYKHKNDLLNKAAPLWRSAIVLISPELTVSLPDGNLTVIPGIRADLLKERGAQFWGLFLALATYYPNKVAQIALTALSVLKNFSLHLADNKEDSFRSYVDKIAVP